MVRLPWTVAASLVLAALTGPTPASAQTVTCADFDSQIWAQSIFEDDPDDNAALDPVGDGVACPELATGAAPALWTDAVPEDAEPAALVRIVDGDTIEASVDGQVEDVRLILVNTPETVDPRRPVQCFGPEASAFTTWLLSLGGDLYLERDVTDRDRFDRLLRYAWLDFGDGEVYMVSEAIVRAGFGEVSTFPPDVKYVDEMREAQTVAREHAYGLWSACDDATDDLPQTATQQPTGPVPQPAPTPIPPPPPQPDGCDPSYPTLCIPPGAPDIDCGEIGDRRFPVLPPDPHGFDGDFDGVGCESG